MKTFFHGEPASRSDLFSGEQLTRHAVAIAAHHRAVTRRGSDQLLKQLGRNEDTLQTFNRASLGVSPVRRITPAAEWLLDNFYLIEEQIHMARLHLPRKYSRELPLLLNGPSAGLPRVYDIILEYILHVDGQIDEAPLSDFIQAYQTVVPFKLGELWAIPIMLRLGLIETLQRLSIRMTRAREHSDLADLWAERLQGMAEKNPSHLVVVVAEMAQADLPFSSSFVAEFSQRLSQHSPSLHLARNWLEQRLVEQGLTIEQVVQQESRHQAADQVSTSHILASFRLLSSLDWKTFVEELSLVNQTLCEDPSTVYSRMDFATRDRYRHSVEAIARYSSFSQREVAQAAINLAVEATMKNGKGDRSAHVGYYLIDKGQARLERMAKVRWPWRRIVERIIRRFPLTFFAGGVGLLTLLTTATVVRWVWMLDVTGMKLVAFSLVFILCASQLSVALMNWLSMLLVKPFLLPRLDFSEGIAKDCRTMVVLPTMLSRPAGVTRLIETLEVHYLANRDPCVHFALLTDFRDAAEEVLPGDNALLAQAREGIEMLNRTYACENGDRFYLLHRPRRWNPGEERWMGYERKRGKLEEFNQLLRGGPRERFSEITGDPAIFPSIQYVITLDTDTQLPRNAARKLVGTMTHPLNHPEFDPQRGVVTEGYGILQPRVGVSLPSSHRSWFVQLLAGDTGIDPYTRAVSDVYQDVFGEGSFIGKGIYDVDAFQQAMRGRVPENTVLSHDLLEACHVRSALVSDVEFYEEYPSRYNVDVDRRHRWIRGDWQIAQWLLPRVPGADSRRIANPLSALSRWKIFDNLRRSLVPVALMLLILGCWVFLPEFGEIGVLLVLTMILIPGVLAGLLTLVRKPVGFSWPVHLRTSYRSGGRHLSQILLTLSFLPYDAFVSLDAVGRTLVRLLVTHKRMLEWQTSGDSEQAVRSDLTGFYATMWFAPTLAVAAGLFLGFLHLSQLLPALPILGLWILAPWLAWWISLPLKTETLDLTEDQWTFLGSTARRTWHFFETFVTADEHWLPPDNFQEVPTPAIASRTSPTNMGLALLANLAARDMGYLSMGGMIRRTHDTLATMQDLERYRGHFYNWYDTRTLRPLLPLYISSVDSGNLAGHLLTLGAGLREQGLEKIISPQVFSGLRDTVEILKGLSNEDSLLSQLDADLENGGTTLQDARDLLERTASHAAQLSQSTGVNDEERKSWAEALRQTCLAHLEDLQFLAPWLWVSKAAGAELEESIPELNVIPTMLDISTWHQSLILRLEAALRDLTAEPGESGDARRTYLPDLIRALQEANRRVRERMLELEDLAGQAENMAAMDFTFLLDPARDLFSIGFNIAEGRQDVSFYDLLASEARLCSYVAIALGQVTQDHWFSMGRLLIAAGGDPILVSWSGSMFEYLMPLLVMPSYENTLLDHTCKAAVQKQIAYGKLYGVPWGISESGYNRTDVQLTYQYRAFGVPGLGLKRGLAEDLVIAPYATVMALMVAPREACENLQRLAADGREGRYGFYEAVDYTKSRLRPDETSATVQSFMTHHQGMSLLALTSLRCDSPMQRRFLACPILKATELLLQERVPRTTAGILAEHMDQKTLRPLAADAESIMRVFTKPSSPTPELHLLSNGRYHVVISSAGGGYSRWGDLAVTRWREDATRDCWGSFLYLRDQASGEFWSAGFQPTLRAMDGYEAVFTQARAEFRHRYTGLEVHTAISVSPEDDVELRRVTVTNRSSETRVLELTSYAEVVLALPGSDEAHPAFSNLFVQTEFIQASSTVLCTRRPRSKDEHPPWLLHMMVGEGVKLGSVSCETDRSQFIGRGGSPACPAAMRNIEPLSNTVGSVLDPVVSLRRTVSVPPNKTAVVDIVMGVTESRRDALAHVEKYQRSRMVDRAFDLAWTHSQVILYQINATEADAQLYGRLVSALIYADPDRRANPGVLMDNRRGQSALWRYGISGDAPLVLLRISDGDKMELVQQFIKAHSYWRMKGLAVDLVILNEDVAVYRQSLHDEIIGLITSSIESHMLDVPGGIFVRRLEHISQEDLLLLQSVARIVMDDEKGPLQEQMKHLRSHAPVVSDLIPVHPAPVDPAPPLPSRDLLFKNGLGGFTPDGREYVITLKRGQTTPAPWVNVLANPFFGTVVSESGSAYTWVENAHEFRLTPWNNDPVQDSSGEAFYIRDEETGRYWSPSPWPARGATPYVIRHGFGYTVFEHTEYGITSELWVYVSTDTPVKFAALKVRNISGRPRHLSLTGYWEWVLSDLRKNSLLHVQTQVDLKTGALLAQNAYSAEFSERIVFIDVNDAARTLTGDRQEFIGRNGSLTHPVAMNRARLSGKVGAGLDPCGALQVSFHLREGQERETTFRLGVGRGATETKKLINRFRGANTSRAVLEEVWGYWSRTLGAVQVETPDASVNMMANGWLLYQTLSCRLWGRSGFYQSGGAFGFRDQLQDVMALVHAEPALTREHLLRAAAHQFREGDVQHWWHPPAGRGVRTHISDDYLWLPYVTCRYVSCIRDTGVLDEVIPYLEARPVKSGEESYYDLPNRAEASGTLYEHCVLAIEHGLSFGSHGLPLMGCGDWNDGMNRVGHEGKGESVWLAFFLYDVLSRFAELARLKKDLHLAERCIEQARQLQENIAAQAWDGQWYLRAFFDSGEPLGSRTNLECQIDALPQSWAVLSGAGEPERARQAMQAVDQRLVRPNSALVQVLDPPFAHSDLDPGYIKGYIPGVRENGGQYTHAAIWAAMAFAQMGETERAWDLFTLLNPIHHGATPEQIATYKVEPYVVAADVYSMAPHAGRGGWTWYTGSASWMYRLLVETLLGVTLEGDQLSLNPHLPKAWDGCTIHYRFLQTVYHIRIIQLSANDTAPAGLMLDGQELGGKTVPLLNNHHEHVVEMRLAPGGRLG